MDEKPEQVIIPPAATNAGPQSSLFAPTCAGNCRRLSWNKELKAYVCMNCGKVDR